MDAPTTFTLHQTPSCWESTSTTITASWSGSSSLEKGEATSRTEPSGSALLCQKRASSTSYFTRAAGAGLLSSDAAISSRVGGIPPSGGSTTSTSASASGASDIARTEVQRKLYAHRLRPDVRSLASSNLPELNLLWLDHKGSVASLQWCWCFFPPRFPLFFFFFFLFVGSGSFQDGGLEGSGGGSLLLELLSSFCSTFTSMSFCLGCSSSLSSTVSSSVGLRSRGQCSR